MSGSDGRRESERTTTNAQEGEREGRRKDEGASGISREVKRGKAVGEERAKQSKRER